MNNEKKVCWWQQGMNPSPMMFSFIKDAYRNAQKEYDKALRDIENEISPDPDIWQSEGSSEHSFFTLPSSVIIGEVRTVSSKDIASIAFGKITHSVQSQLQRRSESEGFEFTEKEDLTADDALKAQLCKWIEKRYGLPRETLVAVGEYDLQARQYISY